MMSFELESPTKARILEVVVLSQKNRRADEDPGAKLSLQVLVGNDLLASFDGALKTNLFTRDANSHPRPSEAQGTLDGVPVVSDLPDLTWLGSHVKTLRLSDSFTGYSLRIDHGIGGRSSINIDECVLSNFRLQAQKGGTVLTKFDLESPNVSDKIWGKLARLKSIEVDVVLLAPRADQGSIDDEPAPAGSVIAPDATSAFLSAHAGAAQ